MPTTENTTPLRLTAAGLAGLVLVLMFAHWYRATLGDDAITASAWDGFAFGRILLFCFAVGTAGMCLAPALAPLAGRDVPTADDQELGHSLVLFGGFLALYLALRLAVPPHFYQVTDWLGTDTSSDGVSVHVLAPAVIALFATAGIAAVGYRLAVASGGFDVARCGAIAREMWRSRSARVRRAELPTYRPPSDGSAE